MRPDPLKFLIPVFGMFLLSCGGTYSSEITEQFEDGTTKTIRYYRESDSGKDLYKTEEFYNNGIKRVEGYFEANKRHGRWNSWHSNGKLWSVASYRNGNLHGHQTVYYPSGEKFYEGDFENGIRTGTWYFWDEQGNLVNQQAY